MYFADISLKWLVYYGLSYKIIEDIHEIPYMKGVANSVARMGRWFPAQKLPKTFPAKRMW